MDGIRQSVAQSQEYVDALTALHVGKATHVEGLARLKRIMSVMTSSEDQMIDLMKKMTPSQRKSCSLGLASRAIELKTFSYETNAALQQLKKS
jgi:hypothetical protein